MVGEIFASPSTKQILNAIRLVNENASGVLLIVKNYTGDVLHFGLSAERARALGINCRVAVIGDDVAVGRERVVWLVEEHWQVPFWFIRL